MLFDSLIFLMIGASIFGLGVGLGAIIEFRRSKECFSEILIERDETYIQNTEAFLESANRIEGKIRILHQRISPLEIGWMVFHLFLDLYHTMF